MSARTTQAISPETIRAWRVARSLTQQEAADYFGVSRQAWQHWELGDREIPSTAETIMWLWDNHPHIKSLLTQLMKIRYAGETIIAAGTVKAANLETKQLRKPPRRKLNAQARRKADQQFAWAS